MMPPRRLVVRHNGRLVERSEYRAQQPDQAMAAWLVADHIERFADMTEVPLSAVSDCLPGAPWA